MLSVDRGVTPGSGKIELAGELDWNGFSNVVGREVTLWQSEWEGKKGGKQFIYAGMWGCRGCQPAPCGIC